MPRHGFSVAFMIPHAHEGPEDEDELQRERPSHHPDPQDHVDDRGYLKLWLKQNEAENIYIRALLRDDQQTAERANAEVQRLDRLMHRHQPRAEEDEDESDERDESHDQF